MKKYKVVHYINNFFAGIGGEEKANVPPSEREGAVGPGMALVQALGEEAEVVATVICGDSYFGENLASAEKEILGMIRRHEPDLVITGPAFNAGRYGVACGAVAKAVEEQLGIPAITVMYEENPGVDMYRKELYIIKTGHSAAGMTKAVKAMGSLGLKIVKKQLVGPPEQEGYHVRGIRVNYWAEKRASMRAVEMILKKVKDEEYQTEYPMPDFGRVEPLPPVQDFSKAKVAIVTSGGIVPTGNPDRIESSSATKYGIYDISELDSMPADGFTSIHGGYDRTYALEDINRIVPLDVMRDMEQEGVIGKLADYFVTTTGTGTSVGSARAFAVDFSKKLLEDGVDAVILTSTWGTCTRCGATMVKEIERAGIPVVHIATVVPIALTVGANRIIPAIGIPYPLGDPSVGLEGEKSIRRNLVERALKALGTPIEGQTVFDEMYQF